MARFPSTSTHMSTLIDFDTSDLVLLAALPTLAPTSDASPGWNQQPHLTVGRKRCWLDIVYRWPGPMRGGADSALRPASQKPR